MSTLKYFIKTSAELETQLVQSGGEIDSMIEDFLQINADELKAKIDGYDFLILRMKNLAVHYEMVSKRHAKLAKACEAVTERLLGNIKHVMRENDLKEIEGDSVRFVLSHSTPSVEVFDQDILPQEYMKEVVEYSVDKTKIKEDLKSGKEIPGVKLRENFSLRSYLAHPKIDSKK